MRRVVLLAALGSAGLAVFATPALSTAATAAAPAPKVTIADIEDEVMCPICGELLELAESPQARREKVFVAHLIAAGQDQGPGQGRAGRRVRARGARPAGKLRL